MCYRIKKKLSGLFRIGSSDLLDCLLVAGDGCGDFVQCVIAMPLRFMVAQFALMDFPKYIHQIILQNENGGSDL